MKPLPYHNQTFYLLKGLPLHRPPDACWEWQGTRYGGAHGPTYGQCWHVGLQRNRGAHRIAYELWIGPISDGMDILHRCDNPPCCNPAHLVAGTHRENMLDKVAKGRDNTPRGERAGMSKLTEDAVRDIRRRVQAGETRTALGKEYGVSQVAVTYIMQRRTWAHVE